MTPAQQAEEAYYTKRKKMRSSLRQLLREALAAPSTKEKAEFIARNLDFQYLFALEKENDPAEVLKEEPNG